MMHPRHEFNWKVAAILVVFGLAIWMMACGKIFTGHYGPSPYRVWCLELEYPWYANYTDEARGFVDHFNELGYHRCVAYTVQGDTIYLGNHKGK